MTIHQQPVTTRIQHLIDTVPGWTPGDQLLGLHMLAMTTASLGGDIIEIGSWCGRSTAVLGHAAALSGIGHVHAIDLFPTRDDWRTNPDGTHSLRVTTDAGVIAAYEDQTVWDEPFQRDIASIYRRFHGILDAFNATMEAEGLRSVVTPFRGGATAFANQALPGFSARLAFIDGDHSYDAVCEDINIVERFLAPGGWISFDDAFSSYEGVNQAILERIIGSGRYEFAHQMSRKFFIARRKDG